MHANGTRTATCALEVEVRWCGGTVLRQEHFCPPRNFVLRGLGTGQSAAEFAVSREWLGSDQHTLVSVEEERVLAHGSSGSVELAVGDATALNFGPLTFHVRLSPAVELPRGVSQLARDPKQHAWTAASLAVHALALSCMALLPPKASSLSLDALDQDARYSRYLATPVAREEVLPWSDESTGSDGSEADAAKHADAEGAAGKPDAARTDARMGIRGKPSPTRMPPKVTASTAGAQGILGVLAAGQSYLGPTSPFGPDQPYGGDPRDAMGQLFGSVVGDNSGFGALGMRGTGRGGGGDASGSIGVGRLNTGDGARGAPGHGSLSQLGRTARVPKLRVGETEVKGSLSKEVIRRVIHRNLSQVRFCYERALVNQPDLGGRVTMQFMIAPSGLVQTASVAQSTLENAEVEQCIASALRRWEFPVPENGGYVTVSYPFLFEQSE